MDDLMFLLDTLNANASSQLNDIEFYRCIWLMFNSLYNQLNRVNDHKPRQLTIFDFI